jgi:hypothetical protein
MKKVIGYIAVAKNGYGETLLVSPYGGCLAHCCVGGWRVTATLDSNGEIARVDAEPVRNRDVVPGKDYRGLPQVESREDLGGIYTGIDPRHIL